MALTSLTAKANVGAGTDILGGETIDSKFFGGVRTVSDAGAGAQIATEATLAALAGYFKNEDDPSASGDKGLLLLAVRQVADTPSAGTDGDYAVFNLDAEGRLKVATKPASFDLVSSDITASAQTAFCDVSRASNVMISMVTVSLAGHNVTFEGSLDSTNGTDGNWFGIQVVRSNANTIETTSGVLAATPAYAWEASVNGLTFVRVRATAHTSGTATWKFRRGSYATEPIPAAQVSATQTVNIAAANNRIGFAASSGQWYDDSSTTLAGTATFTGSSRDLTATATATNFASATTFAQELRVSAESDVTGTLWLETSRDNVNWRRVKSIATAAITGGGFAAEIVHRPSWRYARVGYTNGAGAQARFTIGSIVMAV